MVKGHQLRVVLLLIDNPFIQQVLQQAYYSFTRGLEINLELRLAPTIYWLLLRNRLPVDSRGDPSLDLGTRGPIVQFPPTRC